jgi:Asp-tRNA(Asn)/Glu-tRNA(Gln) amidotransferase A subunit family amidase
MLAELAAEVREGRIDPRDLVASAFERIERLNGALNAVTALRDRDEAIAEAASVDREEPLAGLPLLVKDNEHLAGIRTTFGSFVCRNRPPEERDGYIPARLRAAGAVPVGKTNVPEFTFDGFTDNPLFGATRSPWNTAWSPGGSSGGSGAALAAGMVPLATGTDGGGSIRIPAAFCGLAGLKPTHGVVARVPIPAWIDLSTYGPLAVTVADVRLLLGLMAGPAPGDPTALPVPLPVFEGLLPARAFATPRLMDAGPLAPDVAALFDRAVASVEGDVGVPVELLEPGALFAPIGDPYADWFVTCAFEHLHLLGRETVVANLGRFGPSFRRSMEDAMRIAPDEYMAARRRRFAFAEALDRLLGDDAVLLAPTIPIDGWAPDGRVPSTGRFPHGAEGYNTDPMNITGHPALSVPAGVNDNGIPFGLQIAGPRFADHLVLNLGEAWERANPWPHAAPGYEPFGV